MKKKIAYWSPCLNPVGTVKATINSIKSLSIFKNEFESITLINASGEWDNYKSKLVGDKIKVYNLAFSYFKFLPKTGLILSRISYIIISIISLFPLIKFLTKEKPDYIIVHLITSLPLILFNLLPFKTKLILRISGYPKLNSFRKNFWKYSDKNIYSVTAPTNTTLDLVKKNKIFKEDKITYLPDPILEIKEINKQNLDNSVLDENLSEETTLISIGRLTKQKNFKFLINAFFKLSEKYNNYNLIIVGEGEEKNELLKEIVKLNLQKKVFLVGYKENVFSYLKKSKIFVLSSLWEDPGFVLLEAGYMNRIIITSDCPSGPCEILDDGKNGFIYKTDSLSSFLFEFDNLINSDKHTIKQKKINMKKKCKEFTIYNHFKILKNILN